MRRLFMILSLLPILGPPGHAQRPLPLPDSLAKAIRLSEKIGKAIYENDLFSAAATDVLFEKEILPQDRNVRGWLTVETPTQWIIKFYGIDENEFVSLHEVTYSKQNPKYPRLWSHAKPPLLPSAEQAMCRARTLAAQQKFMKCEDHYNTIILTGSLFGMSGCVVYLLAATQRQGEVVVAGHHRMDISSDGKTLLAKHQLSEACLTIPSIKKSHLDKNADSEGIFVTQILTDYPTEIHVFLSLLHHYPFFVKTNNYSWRVKEGKIEQTLPDK